MPVVEPGTRFGSYAVIGEGGRDRRGKRLLECRCDCGSVRKVLDHSLLSGRSRSCGCVRAANFVARATRHGATKGGRETPEHRAWRHMVARCTSASHPSFKDYGGRGITVSEGWRADFAAFLKDVGLRPSPLHSVDRIHNDGNYEPGNVRWATQEEQMSNTRKSRLFDVDGERLPLPAIARRYGISDDTLYSRIKRGLSIQEAVSMPVLARGRGAARRNR